MKYFSAFTVIVGYIVINQTIKQLESQTLKEGVYQLISWLCLFAMLDFVSRMWYSSSESADKEEIKN